MSTGTPIAILLAAAQVVIAEAVAHVFPKQRGLIWQDRRQIEVRARTGDVWRTDIGVGGVATIEALAGTLDARALYDRAGG